MFDDFDTQINCEEFYTEDRIICEFDLENPCISCGGCCVDDDEDLFNIGSLEDAMEY